MRKIFFVGLLGLSAAFWSASCQGPDELYRNGGISVTGAAGSVSQTGGNTGAGGSKLTGIAGNGAAGTTGGQAGTTGIGNHAGTTGAAGTGGGGRAGTSGGIAGTSGGAAGTSGGVAGTSGGRAGTSGGTAGTSGGLAGTNGGTAGTTGTTGVAGTNGAGGAANCIDAIKLNGYSATGAQPCSMCKNNQTDESSKCEKTIDCEDAAYPCDGNCKLNCQNGQGDDSVVTGCVTSLLAAASCS
jgi:hypothetical protein